MKCSKFKGGSELNINYSTIQGLNIEPYDIHLGLYGVGTQVTSQSSGGACETQELRRPRVAHQFVGRVPPLLIFSKKRHDMKP
jgi:hypothetical protein